MRAINRIRYSRYSSIRSYPSVVCRVENVVSIVIKQAIYTWFYSTRWRVIHHALGITMHWFFLVTLLLSYPYHTLCVPTYRQRMMAVKLKVSQCCTTNILLFHRWSYPRTIPAHARVLRGIFLWRNTLCTISNLTLLWREVAPPPLPRIFMTIDVWRYGFSEGEGIFRYPRHPPPPTPYSAELFSRLD